MSPTRISRPSSHVTRSTHRTAPAALAVIVAAACYAGWGVAEANGQNVAPNISLTRVAAGLSSPMFVTAPAGDPRLFIVERAGRIRVIENGSLLPTPVADFSSLVSTTGERGFLGMAFAPDFETSRAFYVNYNRNTGNGDNIIARYLLPVGSNTAVFDANVYTIGQHTNTNHKGGWIGFRPGDGNNLYIAMGDSGGANDPLNSAQNLNSPWGKMLRVTVNPTGVATPAAGNPFSATTSPPGRTDIWSYGLRNPFRASFDRLTGDLYIGDVGQDTREEINVEPPGLPGRNYGWRPREGNGDNPGVSDPHPPNFVDPVYSYNHGSPPMSQSGQRGSVTGGYVYRGTQVPPMYGRYIFGDYVTGRIGSFVYDPVTNSAVDFMDLTQFLNPNLSVIGRFDLVSFGEDGFGELYLVDIDGEIFQLTYNVIPEPGWTGLLAPGLVLASRRRR